MQILGGPSKKTIKSLQKGQGTFTVNVATKDITINAVDMSKSILIIHGYGQTANPNQSLVRVAFVDSSTIRVTMNTAPTGVSPIMFSWQVIEFNGVKSKQSGLRSGVNGQVNVTLGTAVNVTKSMVVTSHTSSYTTPSAEGCVMMAYLSSASNLQLTSIVPGVNVEWQVIEFK